MIPCSNRRSNSTQYGPSASQPPRRVVCTGGGQNIDTYISDEDDYPDYDTKVQATCVRKGQINSRFPSYGAGRPGNKEYNYQWTNTVSKPCPNAGASDQYKMSATGVDGLYYGTASDYSMEDDFIDPTLRFNEDSFGSHSSIDTITRVSDHQKRQTRVCTNVGGMSNDKEAYRVSEVKIPITRSDTKAGKKLDKPCKRPKPKSIMKRFDEAVSFRLQKLIEDTNEVYSSAPEPCAPLKDGRRSVTTRTSLSTIELARSLHPDYKSGALIDATDKLAQAEAACRYDGAIRAAEAAAAGYSEGLEAEEAAAAGVRGYQAELTDTVQQTVSGSKPIEVLGYIGITKPR